MDNNDIIIAPISATQGGSVNLIRLSGEGVISRVNGFFSRDILTSKGGRFYYGQLLNNGDVIDDVIVYVFRAPHSYTGEDVVEISCHGNFFITEEIINLFLDQGCRLAEPGEFSKRAFLNSKMDLIQAEAVADIISSNSKRAVKKSMSQLHGYLSGEIDKLKKQLIDMASLVELEIDFSEEEIEIIPYEKVSALLKKVLSETEALLASWETSKAISDKIQILLLGKPNVGKSSIMNSFINKNRVIVSSTPGTTRDHIHEDIILNDTFVRLVDSAGIREQAREIEKEGVRKSRNLVKESDIILFIMDGSREPDEEDKRIIELVQPLESKLILVLNKNDIGRNSKSYSYVKSRFSGIPVVDISAKKKTNMDILRREIIRKMSFFNDQNTSIITNVRHYKLLKDFKEQITTTIKSTEKMMGPEFLAIDLRAAIDILGSLTGVVTTDEILNNIFSSFCIGK